MWSVTQKPSWTTNKPSQNYWETFGEVVSDVSSDAADSLEVNFTCISRPRQHRSLQNQFLQGSFIICMIISVHSFLTFRLYSCNIFPVSVTDWVVNVASVFLTSSSLFLATDANIWSSISEVIAQRGAQYSKTIKFKSISMSNENIQNLFLYADKNQ